MSVLPRRLLTALALVLATPAMAADSTGIGASPQLPAPDESHAVTNFSRQVGWPAERLPMAPRGFAVSAFATQMDSPRWIYVTGNGDVLVAEARTKPKPNADEPEAKTDGMRASGTVTGSSADRITLLRDGDKDGVPELRTVLLEGLNQPFGMAELGGYLYVGNTDAVVRFPYKPGQERIDPAEADTVATLPAGGYNNHWTRNLKVSADGSKLLVTVGSASNVAENGIGEEHRRANILEMNPDGSGERVLAGGLRNPNGLAYEPVSGALWTAVNERDNLGDELVPDYITSVQDGGFYGWPYAYWGQHEDPRRAGEAPELVAKTIVPDYAVGSHTASLGLAFAPAGNSWPAAYASGAFIGQRGSWNRTEFSGYRVAFVPFADGKPSGEMQDFLTGFMADARTGETYGRPVGVTFAADGALLVADDTGGVVWRVAPAAE